MLGGITIKGFKSVVEQTVELGRVNVFVGANGAGKSVVLEAIGVLGAAADGRVDDVSLLRRGVRPGVPALYKNAFASDRIPRFITLHAQSADAPPAVYDLSLDNPVQRGGAPWRFHTEKLALGSGKSERKFVTRGPPGAKLWGPRGKAQSFKPSDPMRSVVDVPNPLGDPPPGVASFLARLREYTIFDPQTPVLRGSPEPVLSSLGIHGGGLAEAVNGLLSRWRHISSDAKKELFRMLGWARSFGTANPSATLLSPSAQPAKAIVTFTDRFMREGRNQLSAYDASEGALYVIFSFTLLFHARSPATFALENVDHALHPRLARALVGFIADHAKPAGKQVLMTTHNPLVLDALDLANDSVRLFTVDRNKDGHTLVRRVAYSRAMSAAQSSGLTLSQMWTRGLIGGVPNLL